MVFFFLMRLAYPHTTIRVGECGPSCVSGNSCSAINVLYSYCKKLHVFGCPISHCHRHEQYSSLTWRSGPGQAHKYALWPFASVAQVLSSRCHKFGELRHDLKIARIVSHKAGLQAAHHCRQSTMAG
jgi:hypothetical protein